MRTIGLVLLIGVIIIAASVDASAQRRAHKTAAARAYYGEPVKKQSLDFNRKKSKAIKNWTHTKPGHGTRASARSTRRKYVNIYRA